MLKLGGFHVNPPSGASATSGWRYVRATWSEGNPAGASHLVRAAAWVALNRSAGLMAASARWLAGHPLNAARIAAGKRPATNVWLWGAGRAPRGAPPPVRGPPGRAGPVRQAGPGRSGRSGRAGRAGRPV